VIKILKRKTKKDLIKYNYLGDTHTLYLQLKGKKIPQLNLS
jgi:hypothetical protein